MEAARTLKHDEEPTASYHIKQAQRALRECNGDWITAAELMRGWVDADRELFEELVEPLIDGAVWKAIQTAASIDRRHLWNKAANEDDTSGLGRMAESNLRSLYSMPMPGQRGKKLGEAKRPDITRAVSLYGRLEKSNGQRRQWFALILKRMPDEEATVRETIKEKELRRLLESVKE
jgi:hypothetical protein